MGLRSRYYMRPEIGRWRWWRGMEADLLRLGLEPLPRYAGQTLLVARCLFLFRARKPVGYQEVEVSRWEINTQGNIRRIDALLTKRNASFEATLDGLSIAPTLIVANLLAEIERSDGALPSMID